LFCKLLVIDGGSERLQPYIRTLMCV